MELEVVGPRVSVDRNGTGDRGGGQLVVQQGKLLVRTRNLERLLSALPALDYVQLNDLARLQADVRLIDGQSWNVQSEEGEDLTPFFRQVETFAGRPGLLREPPRVSDFMRAAATPSRIRVALWYAFALAVIVVGWVAYSDASERAAVADRHARELAQSAQREKIIAEKEQAAARALKAQTGALAEQLLAAVRSERLRDAKALYDRLEALAPGHPAAKQSWPQLETALAQLDERERVEGITRGVAQARALASDPLACETAKRVADTYALLRRARPTDSDYDAARRVLDGLERCRKVVAARFARSGEDSRRSMRALAATQIESAVRRLGVAAKVSLGGKLDNVLHIEGRELDDGAADRILAMSERSGATFAAARTAEGFARIELRGAKLKRDVALDPQPPEALVVPVLEKFGLANALALQ